jgi:uncharacterized protein
VRPFRLPIADLVNRPGARRHDMVEGRLAEQLTVVDCSVPAGSPVVVDVVLEWVSDGILATGTVSAPWVGVCRRCLGPVGGELKVDVRELFEPEPREGESYPLGHDQLDVEPLAREALALALPLAPLCEQDCRGLCPRCGADLNAGDCDCPPAGPDLRWSALDALRGEDE